MSQKIMVTGKASSIPAGLAVGAMISAVITGLGTAFLAILLDKETISWEAVGYGILTMILLSAYFGAVTAYRKIRRQKMVVCIMSGLSYWGMLMLVTALFFGGQYEAVGVTGLLVAGGSTCAAFLGESRGGSTNRKKASGIRYR